MRRLTLLLALALASCLPGQSTPVRLTPTVRPSPTATPDVLVYTVKPGDTLSQIAEANHSTMEAISKENDISDPDKIVAGQKLLIPLPSPTPAGTAAGEGSSARPAASPTRPPSS